MDRLTYPIFRDSENQTYGSRRHPAAILQRLGEYEDMNIVRCGECRKYQTKSCAARHEQAKMDYCSHGELLPQEPSP